MGWWEYDDLISCPCDYLRFVPKQALNMENTIAGGEICGSHVFQQS